MCRQGSTLAMRALQELGHKGVMPMDGVEGDPTRGASWPPLSIDTDTEVLSPIRIGGFHAARFPHTFELVCVASVLSIVALVRRLLLLATILVRPAWHIPPFYMA